MNEEIEWDEMEDTVRGPRERVLRDELLEAFNHMKIGKAPGPSEAFAEMNLASGDVEIRVFVEL